MKGSTKKLLGGIAGGLALVILVVGGFYATHEKTEVEVREPPSGEARNNPYLALVRLADRVCCTTYWMHKVDQPDYDSMVTFLSDPDRELTPEQVDAWALWVSDGGHLILPATNGPANENAAPLISRLGFEPADLSEDETEDAEDAEEAGEADESAESDEISSEDSPTMPSWIPEGADAPIYWFTRPIIATLDWRADDTDWVARAKDPNGDSVYAASRRHGRGRITVVNDAGIFRNESIGEGEHATVILDIFELPTDTITPQDLANSPTVDIVLFSKRQSWMAYVFGHIWPFFAILAGMLALAFQGGRKRFGPMLADPPEERRSRLEHIDATGRFLWRHGSSATLVESAQSALLRELERSHPGLKKADTRARNTIVAELLEISEDTARELLRPPSGSQNPQTFTRRIRQIEEYRRTL